MYGLLNIRVPCHLKLFMPTMKALKYCTILKHIKGITGRMRTGTVNFLTELALNQVFFQFTAPQGCQRLELGCCSETAPRNAS